jgi:hypothetical protein
MFANAGIIAVVYLLIKFIEMRFIIKESKPGKEILRDTVLVYFSTVIGIFVADQMQTIDITGKNSTNVFVGKPEF